MKEDEFPRWYFGPDGQEKVCEGPEDAPEGWVTHPSLLPAAEEDAKLDL